MRTEARGPSSTADTRPSFPGPGLTARIALTAQTALVAVVLVSAPSLSAQDPTGREATGTDPTTSGTTARGATISDGTASDGTPRDDVAELDVFGDADFGWRIRPLDGEPTTLEAFRGRILFINLWASWCRPCVREMASIERLRDRVADTDVEFLIVAAEDERPVRRFIRRHSYDLPIYLEEQRIPPAFGLIGLPTTWVVDHEGRIVLLRHGEAVWDTDDVEAFLRSLARDP
ncbi:MAG: TlpA family protein disulfide reductase [Longimicrobiales bacterium]